ncbi:DUF3575 domain-containing protein [Chryseobacterium carnipullorum]|uniref:DUF3575 domain-containing protein n=1 Tax=Chryseobacterium carnipullorum TaxID=1124835 RepID=A0A1M7FR92_CHRCU|nr:DUF3575 domain-containing protein [Chryseobacterium carnipullorum]AZA49076.1 DUF3575 domain-containing protein [Chryseobacterium carnipullorum]AZA63971.1 DUF3575 domain-containing protein [Chryseobacterium carnipullorum]SHM06298.1 Protein of unknown function [Chryseobacterium carnipullorum]STC93868.1 Protein of uncharacterised function (DUF3575) [Chryseobacterium carnipullorum]
MLKHKFLTTSITLLSLGMLTAQEQEPEKGLYIKGNALLATIGVLNVGLEKQISQKYTLQGDVFISPWKSFAGHEFQYYSLSLEGRYYFNEAFSRWYIGANIAASAFVLQKWNYWNDTLYVNDRDEVFVSSNLYQKGVSFILGVTGGYQFKVSDRWNIDIYATVGTSQDFYKGYDRVTGQRYELAQKYNKSGEILPYRGGIMISYKLK